MGDGAEEGSIKETGKLPGDPQLLRPSVGLVVAPAFDTKRFFLGGLHRLFWEHISRSCKLHVPLPSQVLRVLPAAQLASPLHHLLGHFFPIPSVFLQHVAEYSFHENWAFPSLFISSCFKLCLSTLTLSQTPGLCLRMSPKVRVSPGEGMFVTEKCCMLSLLWYCFQSWS